MRGLKIAVIAMGLLIVGGFVVVVVTIVDRLSNPERAESVGEIPVVMPSGCSLADAWSEAGRLYLRYAGPGACRQVVILDEVKAKLLGRMVTTEE